MDSEKIANSENQRNRVLIPILGSVLKYADRVIDYENTLQIDQLFAEMYTEKQRTTPQMSVAHTQKLLEFIDTLKNSFVMEEKKSYLMKRLKDLIAFRKSLSGYGNPFIGRGTLEEYLQTYYDILLFLLLNENTLNEHELFYSPQTGLLYTLLRLDVEKDYVSFFSPLALNSIRKMYLLVEGYYDKIKGDNGSNELIRFMEKRVIIEKVQHMFRWFFYDASGELIHAAISPYDVREDNTEMRLPCKNVTKCNSYEAIYELRTAEKILYELKNWLSSGACDEEKSFFEVVLVGDLNNKPLLDLCKYIEHVIPRIEDSQELVEKKLKKRIKIQAYSKTLLNISAEKEWKYIKEISCRSDFDSVFTRTELERLMTEKNAIFLLDCVKLYDPISFSLELSPEYYKQRMANNRFSTWLLDNNIDYCNMNYLNELYNCMNIYMNHKHLGKYVKTANEALVSFCQNYYEKTEGIQRSTLYIYVSDLKAFGQLYNDDNYYMRTERYNQKEIGIIRFTNFLKERGLENKHTDMLTFNLWQMVKHICIKERESFIDLLKEEGIFDLLLQEEDIKDVHVGMDYSDWKKELVLHYYSAGDQLKDGEKLLRSLIVPILQDENDLFQQYFQRAVYSFLYGNAITYDDMLFIYLFYHKRHLLGEIRVAAENDAKKVSDNIDTKHKYSIKRFVEESINKLDFAGFSAEDKYLMSGRGKEELQKIYRNLQESCEHLEYTESSLYKNCKNEGEKGECKWVKY